jgi:hypothetical protein
MRNVSEKYGRENQNMGFMFSNFFSRSCAVCEIMWQNVAELDRQQVTV